MPSRSAGIGEDVGRVRRHEGRVRQVTPASVGETDEILTIRTVAVQKDDERIHARASGFPSRSIELAHQCGITPPSLA